MNPMGTNENQKNAAEIAALYRTISALITDGMPAPRHLNLMPEHNHVKLWMGDNNASAVDAWGGLIGTPTVLGDTPIESGQRAWRTYQAASRDWCGWWVEVSSYLDEPARPVVESAPRCACSRCVTAVAVLEA